MIKVTEKAVDEIKRIQSSDNSAKDAILRIQVVGGGCSGLSYKLGWDSKPLTDQDKKFEEGGVVFVVDAKSYLFLQNLTLDFSDGLNGKGFIFDNPDAKRTCGCGTSFSA